MSPLAAIAEHDHWMFVRLAPGYSEYALVSVAMIFFLLSVLLMLTGFVKNRLSSVDEPSQFPTRMREGMPTYSPAPWWDTKTVP